MPPFVTNLCQGFLSTDYGSKLFSKAGTRLQMAITTGIPN